VSLSDALDAHVGLPDLEVAALAAAMDRSTFAPGAPVFDFSTGRVYLVLAGQARLFYRDHGREITVDVAGRGSIFGLSTLFDRRSDGMVAEAVGELVVGWAAGDRFLALLTERPSLVRHLVAQLAGCVLQAERWLARQGSVGAYARLASVLTTMADEAGSPDPTGGRRIDVLVRHEDLAHHTGASRETITRLLARLEADGRIRRRGRQIVVYPAAGA